MRSRVKGYVEGICACFGDEVAAAGPVEEGRGAAANVERPGAGDGNDSVEDNQYQDKKLYEVWETATKTIRHAGSIAGVAMGDNERRTGFAAEARRAQRTERKSGIQNRS